MICRLLFYTLLKMQAVESFRLWFGCYWELGLWFLVLGDSESRHIPVTQHPESDDLTLLVDDVQWVFTILQLKDLVMQRHS